MRLGSHVTKWRIKKNKQSLHYLESSSKKHRCAALSSTHFIFSDLWKIKSQQIPKAIQFCKKLKDWAGLEVFPCHQKHHVFVFYAINGGPNGRELCTPAKLAQKIQEDEDLLEFFEEHGLEEWALQYSAFDWESIESM